MQTRIPSLCREMARLVYIARVRVSFHPMKKRIILTTCALLFVFNALLGVTAYRAIAEEEKKDKPDDGYSSMAVFARALQLIRQDYVDEQKVDYEELTHSALKGMLANLDPHSQFMEPKDFKGMPVSYTHLRAHETPEHLV